ncbi:hypothetical protein IAD21_00436 [Abditibacteriota bacterium]|nr:hypothetical protein IAD21_00436 [Abditibacteriota bacterium]
MSHHEKRNSNVESPRYRPKLALHSVLLTFYSYRTGWKELKKSRSERLVIVSGAALRMSW